MELNLCPSCDSFVKTNWITCRACGHDLSAAAPEAAERVHAGIATSDSNYAEPVSEWQNPPTNEADPVSEWTPVETQALALPTDEPDPTTPWTADGVQDADGLQDEPVQIDPAPSRLRRTEAPVFQTPAYDGAAANHMTPAISNPADQRSTDAWPTQDFLQPVEVQYQRFALGSPTSQTVNELRVAFDHVPPLDRKWKFVIIGAAVAVALLVLLVGSIGVLGGGTAKPKNKLVALNPGSLPAKITNTTTPAPVGTPGWFAFVDPQGLFSVEFPGQPAAQNAGTADNKITWESDTKDGKSAAIVSTQNAPAGTADSVLNGAIAGDATALNATLKSHSITTQNARRQISAHLVNGQGGSVDVSAYINDGILFTVMVNSSSPDGDPALFGHLTSTLQTTN